MNKIDKKKIQGNKQEKLQNSDYFISELKGKWPEKTTAVLINHGIGNQKPIETLDGFSRGLICSLKEYNQITDLTVEHHLQPKQSGDETYYWFDNFIRIKNPAKPGIFIDVYEYFWANRTEDKTNYSKIIKWLKQVTKGARDHYNENEVIVENSNDKSFFIDKNGKLNYFRYYFVLRVLGSLGVFVHLFMSVVTKYVKFLPIAGPLISSALESMKSEELGDFSNVIGDITIYNDPNPRSDNQQIRKEILNGCVKAIRFLVEPVEAATGNGSKFRYDKVMIAAHSLGTQISFDAINRITHQINLNELDGYDKDGFRIDKNGFHVLDEKNRLININEVISSFITFGSPLDKVAFFFREESEKKEYVKRQVLENFHCFKQRCWIKPDSSNPKIDVVGIKKIFNDITWRNYHDNCDYVSGSLDFYENLINVNCHFKKSLFTHSNYWDSNEFFGDVLTVVVKNDPVNESAVTQALKKYKNDIINEAGVTSVGMSYKDSATGKKEVMRIGLSDNNVKNILLKKYNSFKIKDEKGNDIAVDYEFELTGIAVAHCINNGVVKINAEGKKILSIGSLACAVKSKNNDKKYALTCYHVVKRDVIDDWSYFNYNNPLTVFEESTAVGKVALGFRADDLDIALIELADNYPCYSPFGYRVVNANDEDKTPVYFNGCNTPHGSGTIVHNSFSHAVQIKYDDESIFTFNNIILISNLSSGTAISQSGDSGSLISDSYGNALGVIIGADDKYTYAMKLDNIINKLQLTI